MRERGEGSELRGGESDEGNRKWRAVGATAGGERWSGAERRVQLEWHVCLGQAGARRDACIPRLGSGGAVPLRLRTPSSWPASLAGPPAPAAHLARALQADEGGVGSLSRGQVLARSLAQLLGGGGDVQDVVHHLEGQADGAAVLPQAVNVHLQQGGEAVRVEDRHWHIGMMLKAPCNTEGCTLTCPAASPSRTRAHLAGAAQDRAAHNRRLQQRCSLVLMDVLRGGKGERGRSE